MARCLSGCVRRFLLKQVARVSVFLVKKVARCFGLRAHAAGQVRGALFLGLRARVPGQESGALFFWGGVA